MPRLFDLNVKDVVWGKAGSAVEKARKAISRFMVFSFASRFVYPHLSCAEFYAAFRA
jgi:hypothetical protein